MSEDNKPFIGETLRGQLQHLAVNESNAVRMSFTVINFKNVFWDKGKISFFTEDEKNECVLTLSYTGDSVNLLHHSDSFRKEHFPQLKVVKPKESQTEDELFSDMHDIDTFKNLPVFAFKTFCEIVERKLANDDSTNFVEHHITPGDAKGVGYLLDYGYLTDDDCPISFCSRGFEIMKIMNHMNINSDEPLSTKEGILKELILFKKLAISLEDTKHISYGE